MKFIQLFIRVEFPIRKLVSKAATGLRPFLASKLPL